MVKKKVINFFVALALFALTLLLAQKFIFGSIIGFSIASPQASTLSTPDQNYQIGILKYERLGDYLHILTEFQDSSAKDQLIDLDLQILNEQRQKVSEKKSQIVLNADASSRYPFDLYLANNRGNLILKMTSSNGITTMTKETSLIVPRLLLTGNVISESYNKNKAAIWVSVISFILLIIASKFIFQHHKRIMNIKHFHQKINKKLINLDI